MKILRGVRRKARRSASDAELLEKDALNRFPFFGWFLPGPFFYSKKENFLGLGLAKMAPGILVDFFKLFSFFLSLSARKDHRSAHLRDPSTNWFFFDPGQSLFRDQKKASFHYSRPVELDPPFG